MANHSDVCAWTLGAWPFDATTGVLTLHSGHQPTAVVDDSVIARWMSAVTASNYQRIRTNAMGPWLVEQLVDLGFSAKQELDLLVRHGDVRPYVSDSWRVVRLRSRTAVRIDIAAFGDEWAIDDDALAHAKGATVEIRMRGAAPRWSLRPPVGYYLAGITDDVGYIQRLAVIPAARRGGAASRLIADAIEWVAERNARSVYVNTDVDNVAALSLYGQWGFESVGYHLRVLECDRHTLLDAWQRRGSRQ